MRKAKTEIQNGSTVKRRFALPRRAGKTRRRRRIGISRSGLREENPIIHVYKSWKHTNRRAKRRKIVYFILGDKTHRYDERKKIHKINHGRSKILYIGMTERKDATEPFLALKRKAAELFDAVTGLNRLEVRCISVRGRQNVSAADELETACLHQFEEMFGCRPLGNQKTKGKDISDKELDKLWRRFPPYEKVRPLLREVGD